LKPQSCAAKGEEKQLVKTEECLTLGINQKKRKSWLKEHYGTEDIDEAMAIIKQREKKRKKQ
jgi:hypothetical protein